MASRITSFYGNGRTKFPKMCSLARERKFVSNPEKNYSIAFSPFKTRSTSRLRESTERGNLIFRTGCGD
jgi:hypothetical protein